MKFILFLPLIFFVAPVVVGVLMAVAKIKKQNIASKADEIMNPAAHYVRDIEEDDFDDDDNDEVRTLAKQIHFSLFPARLEWLNGYVSPSGGYVNYAIFELHGVNPKTNRSNKKLYKCRDSEEAVNLATNDGLVAPFDISVIPNDPPTERQLAYARNLGITIPAGACMHDVSALLSRVEDNDEEAPDENTVRKAMALGVHFSRYAGRKTLCEVVERAIKE